MIKLIALALTWSGMALMYLTSPNQRLRSVPLHRSHRWLAAGLLLPAAALWIWAEGIGAGISGWLACAMLSTLSLPVLALFARKGAAS
ncbi:hypothetical protein WG78_02325 [Amantichitinum ursilacus]|uniref:Uncharacterized protein n=2 Tax=Amantichitinum ursilacus TaxID=857265 RepID=A0A0N1JTT5_9NEIS|nr:hypothetical protein WG78_02325 [Amantichitinum ursilacus]